jgi:AhpD family alkylhydroperoxidase
MATILDRISPEVGKQFEQLCAAIDQASPLPPKIKELIRLACVVTDRSGYGIKLHTIEADKLGATQEELLSTVLSCLPVTGMESVASAIANVLATLDQIGENNE